MEVVNIIHEINDVLEYLYISLFFRLFGYPVYNAVDYQKPQLVSRKYSPNRRDIVNIIIADSVGEAREKFGIDVSAPGNSEYIIVSRFRSETSDENVIKFPDSISDAKACSIFFESIFIKANQLLDVLNAMVEMYVECNIINNYYLTFCALRGEKNIGERIASLRKYCDEYAKYIDSVYDDRLVFASVWLHYLVNRICISMELLPEYNWDIMMKYIHVINNLVNIPACSITLLSGLILDEAKRNVGLTVDFYKSRINEYSYYSMYRLARVYEFQLRDRQNARKWLERSVMSNSRYYKSLYKLAVYSEERYDSEGAYKFYNKVLRVLDPVICRNCWQPTELAYYIKTCGRLRSLNNYSNREAVYEKCGEKIQLLICKISRGENSFIHDLCLFMGNDDGLESLLYKNFKLNANNHLENFFDKDFFEEHKFQI